MNRPGSQPANAVGRARGPRGFQGPIVKAKNGKQTMKRIWGYLEKQKAGMVISIFLVILSTLLGLLAPYLIGRIVDDYIIPKDLEGTIRMLLILATIYIGSSLFTWLQSAIMVNVSLKTIRTLRKDLYDKLQTLSLRFFDNRVHGDLMSRVTNDIDQLNNALSQSVIQIFSSVLMVTGVTIAMFSLHAILAVIALLIVPLMIYTTKKIITYSSSNFIKRQRDLGELNGFIEEAISGTETISLFGREEKIFTQFSVVNERLRGSAMAAETVSSFLGPINNFINNLGLAILIGAGAIMTVHGWATVGIIAAFVTYSRQFFRPINQLSSLLNVFQSAIAGAERVFEILDETPDIEEKKNAIPVKAFRGDVEFDQVAFSYAKDKPILKGISFSAKAGQTIALVGPTGSGKTTVINLLSRFYEVSGGEIRIDGINIQDYKISDLRKRIGIVLQDTYLFSGTILDNIRYGRLDATEEEVMEAAKLASAHQFIKHLPMQYHTPLTSGGSNLSQGQKQLLAIARAILADSDIMILDEATSSIDTRTEVEIQEGLNRLMKGRTNFIIAHRLKTIEKADLILVIKDGEIIETGTHRELMKQEGFYQGLYKSQFNI